MTESEFIKEKQKILKSMPDTICFTREEAKSILEELERYRAIGTVEECHEAVEKQNAKTPYVWGDGYSDGKPVYDMYDCPDCGTSYEVDCDNYKYCPECGQRLNLRSCFDEQPSCEQEG